MTAFGGLEKQDYGFKEAMIYLQVITGILLSYKDRQTFSKVLKTFEGMIHSASEENTLQTNIHKRGWTHTHTHTPTSLSGSRKDQPPCSKKPSGSSTIVFMIFVQFSDCTPSVYLMSQELEGRKDSHQWYQGKKNPS